MRHGDSTLARGRVMAFAVALGVGALGVGIRQAAAATITVTTAEDQDLGDPLCSLREAIVAANSDVAHQGCGAGSGDDRIEFALPAGATIELASELPAVAATLTVAGPGMAGLTIDGQDAVPLFAIDTAAGGGTLELVDLTLAHGRGSGAFPVGGGVTVHRNETGIFRRVRFVANRAENGGGAVLVLSEHLGGTAFATVRECLFEDNVAEGPLGGGALHATDGAGLLVVRSTFARNLAAAPGGNGGALFAKDATVEIATSTFSGNRASDSGGALQVLATPEAPSVLRLADSTLTANVAEDNGDQDGEGGAIALVGQVGSSISVEMQNVLVAGNLDAPLLVFPDLWVANPAGLALTSFGSNLIGINAGASTFFPAGSPNAAGDFVGTIGAPLPALLDPLGDHGGPLPTHLPVADPASWVVDHGDCLFAASDQRGFLNPATGQRAFDHPGVANHPASDGCDIGAVEAGTLDGALLLFADGFESGTTGEWSGATPQLGS